MSMNRASVSTQGSSGAPSRSPVHLLQRACACGTHSGGGSCTECEKKSIPLQRVRGGGNEVSEVPDSVGNVLQAAGRPLDPSTRRFFEQRFDHDFSRVRVHTDTQAAQSARSVNALAYTVGRHIAFAGGGYQPDTAGGRHLLAHELAHVVQQRGVPDFAGDASIRIDSSHSAAEGGAHQAAAAISSGGSATVAAVPAPSSTAVLSRADPDATGYVMRMGTVPRSGLQFWPTNVTDTRVGPVASRSGLLDSGASRLNVIIGSGLSIRVMARMLLPLWTTATPFTPASGVALPLDIIDENELARGLLVYNQFYLPVPAMTQWRAGLRFPLPVDLDAGTGVATLHPLQIRALAGAFDPAWAPLLNMPAAATVAPPAATLRADVTAFLGREPTALARGVHLGAMAVTNATSALPFIREAFRQLGPAAFDVVLELMDSLLAREIGLLAAQRDGAAIIAQIRAALALSPGVLTAGQQASVNRANVMLGGIAGVVALAPPEARRARAEKTIVVDTVKLDGSTFDPATQIAVANSIFSQCNIRVTQGISATATPAQTTGWLGGDTTINGLDSCAAASAEERAMFMGADAAFGLSARFRAFFVGSLNGSIMPASAYSCEPGAGVLALKRNRPIISNTGDSASLAHELGHLLIQFPGPHPGTGLMSGRPAAPATRSPAINDGFCTSAYLRA